VASITSEADDYVHEVVAALKAAGVRAEADTRNEKINYKVREHSLGKVPVILAVATRGRGAHRHRAPSGRETDLEPSRPSLPAPPRRRICCNNCPEARPDPVGFAAPPKASKKISFENQRMAALPNLRRDDACVSHALVSVR
jgi:hypothetical protein